LRPWPSTSFRSTPVFPSEAFPVLVFEPNLSLVRAPEAL
jgi:hypothetical protein